MEGSPDDFILFLKNKEKRVQANLPKAIKMSCELVRSTALLDMEKTQRNMSVSYYSGKNRNIEHHPSLPGNAPAPDTGNLRASVHYTVEESGNEVIGRVGTDVEYGKHLEFGTSRMAPRPWLKPALEKNQDKIKKLIIGGIEK